MDVNKDESGRTIHITCSQRLQKYFTGKGIKFMSYINGVLHVRRSVIVCLSRAK